MTHHLDIFMSGKNKRVNDNSVFGHVFLHCFIVMDEYEGKKCISARVITKESCTLSSWMQKCSSLELIDERRLQKSRSDQEALI